MEPRHFYTITWTQPYATSTLRPYLRNMQEQLESSIEQILEEDCEYKEANTVIDYIKSL